MNELEQNFRTLREKVVALAEKLKVNSKREQIAVLESETAQPDFWNNRESAQKTMQELNQLRDDVNNVEEAQKLVNEGLETTQLFGDEISPNDLAMLETEARQADKMVNKLELQTYLSGPYDKSDAVFSIHAGQGGTEACDWAQMLLRMYLKYFDKKGWKTTMVDEHTGDEAGIKSVTYLVEGRFAYGYLKGEKGTHRLVRLSPFNADNLRQTSFAGVEVMPLVDDTVIIDIKPEDIDFEAHRSGGHGGQNVNKVSTAVRIKHIPTGIVVESSTQRFQEQNRKIAMQVLKAKLIALEEERHQQELAAIKGEHIIAGWGTQIRSYVLHPYQLVKDNRTGIETSDTAGVLNGELEEFIQAEVRL